MCSMIIGYARVCSTDQNCDYQIDELTKSGCEKIFIEKASAIFSGFIKVLGKK